MQDESTYPPPFNIRLIQPRRIILVPKLGACTVNGNGWVRIL
jgi:hypothetical protein